MKSISINIPAHGHDYSPRTRLHTPPETTNVIEESLLKGVTVSKKDVINTFFPGKLLAGGPREPVWAPCLKDQPSLFYGTALYAFQNHHALALRPKADTIRRYLHHQKPQVIKDIMKGQI